MSIFHFYLWLNPEQDFDVKDNILRNMDLTLEIQRVNTDFMCVV